MAIRNPKLEVKAKKFLFSYFTMCSKATESPDYSDVMISPTLKPKSDRAYKMLVKMYPEIPILEAPGFNNACYMPDLEKWVTSLAAIGVNTEQLLDDLASKFHLNPVQLRKYLSNDMIFIDPTYKDAFTLSHELGHYVCTRKSPKSTYKLWHSWYGFSFRVSEGLHNLGDLALGGGIISGVIFKSGVGLLLTGISAVSNAASAMTGQIVINAESAANVVAEELINKTGIFDSEDMKEFHKIRKFALSTYIAYFRTRPIKAAVISTVATGGAALLYSGKLRDAVISGIGKIPEYVAHIKDEAGNLIENITH